MLQKCVLFEARDGALSRWCDFERFERVKKLRGTYKNREDIFFHLLSSSITCSATPREFYRRRLHSRPGWIARPEFGISRHSPCMGFQP